MGDKKFYRAIAMLCGTVIGAGVLGLPYVFQQAGFLTGALTVLILGIVVLMLNLFIGEIVLRTPGNHQFPGYAKIYLGKWGKRIMMFSMFFGVYGALVAYLIGEGIALSAIFGGNPLLFSFIFFAIISTLIFIGIKAISKAELLLAPVVLILMGIIAIYAFFSGNFNVSYLAEFNVFKLIIPYGVVLFALVGGVAIPEMKECLSHDRKKLKKAIIIGSIIPLAAYIFFSAITIAVSGANTTEIATIGLGTILGRNILLLGNLFAAFAMLTSALTLGLAMKEIYNFDLKFSKMTSWVLTMVVPLLIFLVGAKSFIKVIGITGAVAGGIDGILIVLMFWQARKKKLRIPEYKLGKRTVMGFVIITMFALGIIYQIASMLKLV
ncbi:GerAB/ArcD/ProY family transporter [archaeon]|jgi:tyrosine-specific transport protein|nr:GerAB/ArcD/ProY family transporter [archaeon]